MKSCLASDKSGGELSYCFGFGDFVAYRNSSRFVMEFKENLGRKLWFQKILLLDFN